jgi:hypothetical protein
MNKIALLLLYLFKKNPLNLLYTFLKNPFNLLLHTCNELSIWRKCE